MPNIEFISGLISITMFNIAIFIAAYRKAMVTAISLFVLLLVFLFFLNA